MTSLSRLLAVTPSSAECPPQHRARLQQCMVDLQGGQHILVEDAREYREGRLPAFLESEPAMLEPLAIHRLEGVFVGEPDSSALLLALNARIGAFGQQGARFVA